MDQNTNYEWIGTFWFPDQEKDKFSGKVTYSPEHGIKLKLILSREHALIHDVNAGFLSRKIMHATVSGIKTGYITLVNVWLSKPASTMGGTVVYTRNGGAELLITGPLLENDQFNTICIAYDDCFNNIFLESIHRTSDSLKFAKSHPIALTSDCTMKMDLFSEGEPMDSVEDLDSVIWALDKMKMEKLKKVAKPIIEDGDFSFFQRDQGHLLVLFSMQNKGFDSFREVEFTWRQFWQLIANRHISIKQVWVHISVENSEGDKRNQGFPTLFSDYVQKDAGRKAPRQFQLPITINSFGEESSDLNLGVIEKTLKEWFRISDDDRFKPVLHGIRRILENKTKMVDTSRYVSLVAEIETFLDLQGEKNTKVNRLVELYADQEWIDCILELATDKSENETIGQWFHGIRNVIVHPKSSQKKSGGKYWSVASDPFQIQKAYAHLSGLYLKAILLSLGDINPRHIDKYTRKYILSRGNYEPIVFK